MPERSREIASNIDDLIRRVAFRLARQHGFRWFEWIDLQQTIRGRVIQGSRSFDPSRLDEFAYCKLIIKRAVIDLYRRRNGRLARRLARAVSFHVAEADGQAFIEHSWQKHDLASDLADLRASLDPELQPVFDHLGRYSLRETAKLLGISLHTVRAYKQRIRAICEERGLAP